MIGLSNLFYFNMPDTDLLSEVVATNREIKKRNETLTCFLFMFGIPVLLVVGIFIFYFVIGFLDGVSRGMSETNTKENSMSRSEKCKLEAQERAESLLRSKLSVLKKKKDKTEWDIEDIEQYQNMLDEGLVLRDDYDYLYNECMK